MVRQVQAAGSGDFTWHEKGRSPGVDFADAKQFAQAVLSAIHGKLGYATFIATRPWIGAYPGKSNALKRLASVSR